MQDRRLVFGENVAGLQGYGRKDVRAEDLLRGGGRSGRMEAWLLFEIVEDEGLGL